MYTLNVNIFLFYQTSMSYMYLSNGDMAILKRKIYMLILML